MNIKKKILLGSKDVITRTDSDEYINFDLVRTTNEIRPSVLNHNFNQGDQFAQEQQASLKFCIYGTIESKRGNCSNVKIEISSEDGTVLYLPSINNALTITTAHTINSFPLSKNGDLSKNLYEFEKGCYLFQFEISRAALEDEIAENKKSGNLVRSKKLKIFVDNGVVYDFDEVAYLYFDSNGDLVPFGEDFIDLDNDGNVFDIETDYPFLYDSHWIKKDLNLLGPSNVSFKNIETSGGTINELVVNENISTLIPGSVLQNSKEVYFTVSLDKPSKFGREEVTVGILSDNTVRNSGVFSFNSNSNEDFIFNETTVKWSVGEQDKLIPMRVVNDFYVENTEEVIFELKNPVNTIIFSPRTFKVTIQDDDIASIANFEIANGKVNEGDEIEIFIKLDKPVRVAGQTIDIFFDRTNISSKNLANPDSDFYIKQLFDLGKSSNVSNFQVEFPIDSDTASFKVIAVDDASVIYILDKIIKFKLANPSQNLKIGNQNTFELSILDVYNDQFAKFTIPTDSSKGYGIFRQLNNNFDFLNYGIEYNSSATTSTSSTVATQPGVLAVTQNSHFITNFTYSIQVRNSGERIKYSGTTFEKGEVILIKNVTGGSYDAFSMILPTNKDLDQTKRAYKNTMYEFRIMNIEPIDPPPSVYQSFSSFADFKNSPSYWPYYFSDITITTSSVVRSFSAFKYTLDYNYGLPGTGLTENTASEYFLITDIESIKSRGVITPGSFGVVKTCLNGSFGSGLPSTTINGTIILNDYLMAKAAQYSGFGNSVATRVRSIFFQNKMEIDTCAYDNKSGSTTSQLSMIYLPTTF